MSLAPLGGFSVDRLLRLTGGISFGGTVRHVKECRPPTTKQNQRQTSIREAFFLLLGVCLAGRSRESSFISLPVLANCRNPYEP